MISNIVLYLIKKANV